MFHKLGLSAIALVGLGACSFHASAQAGTRTASQREPAHTEERASNTHGTAGEADEPKARNDQLAVSDKGPEHHREAAPATPDGNHGHGNDADGVDEDNPGKSKTTDKAQAKAEKSTGDHDRGHGNDADGVDEDNPGKSKGKKGK